MPENKPLDALRLCLVSDDELTRAVLRLNAPPPHEVIVFARAGLLDAEQKLAEHGLAIVRTAHDADVVLVDWLLAEAPEINTLCYQIRKAVRTPVLALCPAGADTRVAAIAAGADDAVTLPLHLPSLRAQVLSYRRLVQAAWTATGTAAALTEPAGAPWPSVRTFGPLRLNRTTHRFHIHDQEVDLTPREFALLEYLIAHADTLCTREHILEQVWGLNFDTGTNMVEVYMYFLRRKLEAFHLADMIQTVRGRGYRLVLPTPPTS